MKFFLKHYFINTLCLYFISTFVSGMVFSQGVVTVLITGAVLTLFLLLVKPVINVLLLPINLITFGVFRWISSAIALYLVTLIILDFKIEYFNFPGFTSNWFDLPSLYLSIPLAYVAYSLVISIMVSVFYWIIK